MSLVMEQPPPEPSDKPAVWDLVLADMAARDAEGRRKYGVPLQPGNGRDALTDAYQEALDLCAYLRQAIYEREEDDTDLRQHKEERLRLRVALLRLTRERDEARAEVERLYAHVGDARLGRAEAQVEGDRLRSALERLAMDRRTSWVECRLCHKRRELAAQRLQHKESCLLYDAKGGADDAK